MPFADMYFELSGELNLPQNLVATKLNEALGAIYDDEEQRMWSLQIREADNWLTPGLVFQTGKSVPAIVQSTALLPITATPYSTGSLFASVSGVNVTPYSTGFQFENSVPGEIGGTPYSSGFQFATIPSGLKLTVTNAGFTDSGMITATPYSDQIVGDANATLAWQAYVGQRPFLTEMQIRSPFYSLYNIIAYDGVSTLTLDRPWGEPGGLQPYMIYQAYFPTPTADFKRFFDIRDLTNSGILDYWSYSQRDLADRDPQRIIFDMPTHVVFRGWDVRGAGTANASATLGYPLYELWPHPLSQWPYTFSSLRRGPMLVNPSDTLPAPITEDMLKWRTREALYLFKEAQKGEQVQRGAGADWHFLAQAAAAEYKAARNRIGKRDTDIVDLFFTRFRRNAAYHGSPFATITGGLNVGGW